MRISTFWYTLRQGAKNIWKNKMFSLASIATMSACIFLFGIFYSVVVNFQSVVREVESGVAVTVFFVDGATQEQIDAIGEQIGKRVEVSEKVYVSAEEAWENFKKIYFKGAEDMAQGFAPWRLPLHASHPLPADSQASAAPDACIRPPPLPALLS